MYGIKCKSWQLQYAHKNVHTGLRIIPRPIRPQLKNPVRIPAQLLLEDIRGSKGCSNWLAVVFLEAHCGATDRNTIHPGHGPNYTGHTGVHLASQIHYSERCVSICLAVTGEQIAITLPSSLWAGLTAFYFYFLIQTHIIFLARKQCRMIVCSINR